MNAAHERTLAAMRVARQGLPPVASALDVWDALEKLRDVRAWMFRRAEPDAPAEPEASP